MDNASSDTLVELAYVPTFTQADDTTMSSTSILQEEATSYKENVKPSNFNDLNIPPSTLLPI